MSLVLVFGDSQYPHFITFAVINRIDALSRPIYKDIIVNSLKFCQQEKGLIINGWIIMTNHVHLIACSKPGFHLADMNRGITSLAVRLIIVQMRKVK